MCIFINTYVCVYLYMDHACKSSLAAPDNICDLESGFEGTEYLRSISKLCDTPLCEALRLWGMPSALAHRDTSVIRHIHHLLNIVQVYTPLHRFVKRYFENQNSNNEGVLLHRNVKRYFENPNSNNEGVRSHYIELKNQVLYWLFKMQFNKAKFLANISILLSNSKAKELNIILQNLSICRTNFND